MGGQAPCLECVCVLAPLLRECVGGVCVCVCERGEGGGGAPLGAAPLPPQATAHVICRTTSCV